MELKDKLAVAGWLRGNCSMHEVERVQRTGLVGNERFTPRAKRTFALLWERGAYRFSSTKQERWYQLFGSAGVERRMERARSLARAIAGLPVTPTAPTAPVKPV